MTIREFRDIEEKKFILSVLHNNDFNCSNTSKELGVCRSALYKIFDHYDIDITIEKTRLKEAKEIPDIKKEIMASMDNKIEPENLELTPIQEGNTKEVYEWQRKVQKIGYIGNRIPYSTEPVNPDFGNK